MKTEWWKETWTKNLPTQEGYYWVYSRWERPDQNCGGTEIFIEYLCVDEKGPHVSEERPGPMYDPEIRYFLNGKLDKFWFMGPLDFPPPPGVNGENT